jgi:lysyl-tRNA synthetase class 2
MLEKIRAFFSARDVLEVETPLLCSFSVTDVHLESFKTVIPSVAEGSPAARNEPVLGDPSTTLGMTRFRFLQTSPEYAMKRLLAENSGPIFQICKSFRCDEAGNKHNPEFSMLEWYRPGFNHHQLMDEMDALLMDFLETNPALRMSYQKIFQEYLSFDPFLEDVFSLRKMIRDKNFLSPTLIPELSRNDALDLLFTHFIEPFLGQDKSPVFVYDFPPEQAALAKIRNDNPPVGERFEVYFKGMELANGFHELNNPEEQLQRFLRDQKIRKELNKFVPEIDFRLIEALKKGLPDCSGVALGLDRLLMLKIGSNNIKDVLCFPWEEI